MTEAEPAVELIFLWHHHQPDYRSPRDGRSLFPWVRLHASKDYLDMAERLARWPRLHAAFNFVPSLLDQLHGVEGGAPDVLFDMLARDVASLGAEDRGEITARCAIAPRYALERWSAYRRLVERAGRTRSSNGRREGLNDEELLGLEVWFLLAWVDPMYHGEPEAAAALEPGRRFDPALRDGLIALHRRLTGRVVPAYRALAATGQIELSASPYNHPILPLLIDHAAARRARPEIVLPSEPFAAPEDATAQIERGLARHQQAFGARPTGMWPPEGSVSPEAAELMARGGLKWAASDENVLWASLATGGQRRESLYRPWRVDTAAGPLAMFFRDHELSDRIGFVYQHWDAGDAVKDFLGRVRRIARDHAGPDRPVISVILDGENCWEHYPDDGGPFLDMLYAELDQASDIRTCTPSEALASRPDLPLIERLHSGSWINADFRIWIGHPEKNRAWDLVTRARRALVAGGKTPQSHPPAWEALYAAEGSDWFWWFGEDHFTPDKALFDRLFREHLQGVYERADMPVPGWLQVPIAPARVRRGVRFAPTTLLRPVLDGRQTNYYEWEGAGRHRLGGGGGSMHRDLMLASDLFFGFDLENFYLRVDFAPRVLPRANYELALEMLAPRPLRLRVAGLTPGSRAVTWRDPEQNDAPVPGALCCIDNILELGVPFASLGLVAGEAVEMLVHLVHDGQVAETLPADDLLRFQVPDADFESAMWSA